GALEDAVEAVLVAVDVDAVQLVRAAVGALVAGEDERRHRRVRRAGPIFEHAVRDSAVERDRTAREGRVRRSVDGAPGAVRPRRQAVQGPAVRDVVQRTVNAQPWLHGVSVFGSTARTRAYSEPVIQGSGTLTASAGPGTWSSSKMMPLSRNVLLVESWNS